MNRDHGTRSMYTAGCRCEDCRRANREDQRERDRLQLYGRWNGLVDAGPARARLLMLMESGIGWKRAAALAGVSTGSVSKILYGGPGDRPPARRIRPATEAAILAVKPAPAILADGALVDATGTRRRIQALVARGWSQSQVAARLGWTPANLGHMLHQHEKVTAATRREVRALYEALWDKPPPELTHREKIAASRARRYAAERRWPPPMAWDEDAIDDPAARPGAGWRRRDAA